MPDSDLWTVAVAAEVQSLQDNQTFEVVHKQSLPSGAKTLSFRWVFAIKEATDNTPLRYKARLVVRGDYQREGLDYGEVYSPVVNGPTLRLMLAIAAERDYELDQLDAVTAFLNAPLEEELYMRVPDGYAGVSPDHVLRLRKSLYGLKQAPRCWNQMLSDWLLTYGLQQSLVDACLYVLPGKLWVAFWVDDFLVMGASKQLTTEFKNAISQRFKMRDLGSIQNFLGMEVTRNRSARTLCETMQNHIATMATRFGVDEAKPVDTPLPPKLALSADEGGTRLGPRTPYRAIVGSLLYIATWARPDIAFAVTQLARWQGAPTEMHWTAAKHVLSQVHEHTGHCLSSTCAC